MSMDAGATWTDVTGDVGGESMHPDQHAIAFVPGNPDKFFVGSDGGVIRTSGEWADASSQCDERDLRTQSLGTGLQGVAEPDPDGADDHERRSGTLQMNSISVSPFEPNKAAMTGTQDNGTLVFTGSERGSSRSRATAATAASTQSTRTSASTRTPAVRWT